MEETAYAKINLALHVRARMSDGYHRIETLFAFCEEGDRLTVTPAETLTLSVTGPFAAALAGEGDNLVLRAARALASRVGHSPGAALTLDKRLPVASGIGGGSADAAAALRLLAGFWKIGDDPEALHAIACTLGADVPACLASRSARGEGRGEQLTALDPAALSGIPVLLVHPAAQLSTGAVFKAWDGIDRGPLADLGPLEAARAGRNDLETSALNLTPVINDVLNSLHSEKGTILVRMSGSGATCFALFESVPARDAAHRRMSAEHSHWWLLATCLR